MPETTRINKIRGNIKDLGLVGDGGMGDWGAGLVSAMDSSVGLGLLFINDYLCVWGI